MSSVRLSGIVVARDDEATIGATLDSLASVCDEIVLVDCGSTDRTCSVAAARERVRLYHRPHDGDLADQLNFALDQALGEWVLLLQGGEVLENRGTRRLRRWIRVPGLRWFAFRRQGSSGPDDRTVRLFRNVPGSRFARDGSDGPPRLNGWRGLGCPLHRPRLMRTVPHGDRRTDEPSAAPLREPTIRPKRMRVLLFAPYSLWTPHLETDLEIAENHLASGDEVTLLACERDLEICEPNQRHDHMHCLQCIGKRNAGIRSLSGRVTVRRFPEFLTGADRRRIDSLRTAFTEPKELRAYRFDAFDVGFAAHASLVWLHRDSDLDLSTVQADLRRFMRASCETYLAVRNYLRDHEVDRAYVFNGRMAPMRAALRACQELGVECFVHERGCDLEHYSLHRNALPHEIAHTEHLIRSAWEAPDPPREEKVRIAERWYGDRADGVFTNWYSFSEGQDRGRLPDDWKDDRRNVAIFTTSEYEYAAISDEWDNPIFEDTAEGIRRIVEASSDRGDVHLYLRLHPNLAHVHNKSTRIFRGLEAPGLTVIPPESEVCSYALMNACEKVVVTASTVGIEAAFRGKPVILAGRCFYRNLGSTHLPASFDELMELIMDPHLPPKGIEGALMYGYYLATFGIPFEHFEPDGVASGLFKGQRLEPRRGDYLRVRGATVVRRVSKRLRRLARILPKRRATGLAP